MAKDSFKLKLTNDTLHLDYTDPKLGKGTIVAIAPDKETYPESYALFKERALKIVDLWNNDLIKNNECPF